MSAADSTTIEREPQQLGQKGRVIGGSAEIGLETARLARADGAEVTMTCPRSRAPAARRSRPPRTLLRPPSQVDRRPADLG